MRIYTLVPQPWQKAAPGASRLPQPEQLGSASGPPQLAQYRAPGVIGTTALQLGQGTEATLAAGGAPTGHSVCP